MVLIGTAKRKYQLEREPFGNGGEADIFLVRASAQAAKIFHSELLKSDYLLTHTSHT